MSTDEKPFNSKDATIAHILRVRKLIEEVRLQLLLRGQEHDKSKLQEPEKPMFDKETPLLKTLKYGTPEYQDSLDRLKPALDHHYATYRHHPEHFPDGVNDMNLIDLMEMFVDWMAASERTKEGNKLSSVRIGAGRFKLSDQLAIIMENTVREMFTGPAAEEPTSGSICTKCDRVLPDPAGWCPCLNEALDIALRKLPTPITTCPPARMNTEALKKLSVD